ncbi:MAG: TonB-dependent receptor [Porticoccaceae bacterium]|nr:TonB-dependent receptor [Porticoccaceae bacterium]
MNTKWQITANTSLPWRLFAICLWLSLLSCSLYGAEGRESSPVSFDIAPQPLESALIDYSRQAGVQIISSSDVVKGINTQGVSGVFDVRTALDTLLNNTGFGYSFTSSSTAIVRLQISPQQDLDGVQAQHQDQSLDTDHRVQEEVVVTGSRLPRTSGLNTPMPVTVVERQEIASTLQQNVNDVLLQLPQIQVGNNQQTGRNTTSQGGGQANVNLRGLGVDRTLVLVNGRRHVAGAGLSAAVDLNTIPAVLVERVEVVTGGASAVYGADAVSGAINLVLKDDFEGLELDLQTGITGHGDGQTYRANLLAGSNFNDDRGNITVTLNWDDSKRVSATDRAFASNRFNTIRDPAGRNSPFNIHTAPITFFFASDEGHFSFFDIDSSDPRFFADPDAPGNSPLDTDGDDADETQIFLADGSAARPFDFGDQFSFGRILNGDGGDFERFDQLRHPVDRLVFSGNLSYHLADNLSLFVESKYARTKSGTRFQPVEDPLNFGFAIVKSGNPLLPAATQALLDERNLLALPLRKIWTQYGVRATENQRDTVQFVLGLKGEVQDHFNWQIYTSYGDTQDVTWQLNNRLQQQFEESLDAVLLDGNIVCADESARARGCVPLNPFGVNTADPAAIAYSRVDTQRSDSARQRVFGAHLQASPFTLPAGNVGLVLGYEYRKEQGNAMPGAIQQQGLSLLPRQQITFGEFDVNEFYAEVSVPLISDVPLVHYLGLEAAIREADYSTADTNTSWNVGLTWAPSEDLRLRGVSAQAVRAPNLGELFSPAFGNFQVIDDPCDAALVNEPGASPNRQANCLALGLPEGFVAPTNGISIFTTGGGNTELDVEAADTLTLGVVFTPRWLPDFSATVDYWNIEIADAITTIGGDTILRNCVDAESVLNIFCSLVTRNPATGGITNIVDRSLNSAGLMTSGVDIELGLSLPGFGADSSAALAIHFLASRIHTQRFFSDQLNPESGEEFAGFTPIPEWRFNLRTTYHSGPYLFSIQGRFFEAMRSFDGQAAGLFDIDDTGRQIYLDLFAEVDLSAGARVRMGIKNLTDNDPPQVTFGSSALKQGIEEGALYPNLGRSFFLGMNYVF